MEFTDELLSVGMSSPLTQEVIKEAEIPKEVTDQSISNPPITESKKTQAPFLERDTPPKEPPKKEVIKEELNPEDYSGAALLALQLQKDGVFNKDLKIDKTLTSKELRALAIENFKKDALEIEDELKSQALAKGYDEEDLKYARLLRQGVDREELSTVSTYRQMAAFNAENIDEERLEEHTPLYLSQYFKDSGVKDEKAIKKLVDSEIEEDGGESKIKEANVFYGKLASEEIKRIEYEAAEKIKAAEEKDIKNTTSIKETISKGKIGPYELTVDDQKDFEKYLFESTDEIIGSDGKKHKVPAYYKDLADYNTSTEKQLLMAFLMKRKFTFEDLIEQGKDEDKKDMLDYLDKSTKKIAEESRAEQYEVLFRT